MVKENDMSFEELLDELTKSIMKAAELAMSGVIASYNHMKYIDELKQKLIAMHTAATSSSPLRMRPRRAECRDGKAVGDVPEDGEYILVANENNVVFYGCFSPMMNMYNLAGVRCLGHFRDGSPDLFIKIWKHVSFWYRLPTIETDENGNIELGF